MKQLLVIAILLTGQLSAETKPRVFLTDHAVEVSEVTSQENVQAGKMNPEMANSLIKNCANKIVITTNGSKADYVVIWQEVTNSSHLYDYSVFNRIGDLIGHGSTNRKGTAAKEMCRLLTTS